MSAEKLSITGFLVNSIGVISGLTFGIAVLMYVISLVLCMLYKKFEHPTYAKCKVWIYVYFGYNVIGP